MGEGNQVWVGFPNRLLTLMGFQALLHEPQVFAAVETETWDQRWPWYLLNFKGSCFHFVMGFIDSLAFVLAKQCVFKKMLIYL